MSKPCDTCRYLKDGTCTWLHVALRSRVMPAWLYPADVAEFAYDYEDSDLCPCPARDPVEQPQDRAA